MKKKRAIITFKVDESLHSIIKDIPNRSEFIRSAIIEALGSTCPLCNGSGMLSREQKRHWDEFATDHAVVRCDECQEQVLVCSNKAQRG
jgi:metal-responsive CopG/Arc/MetJ family transcriptional regulator